MWLHASCAPLHHLAVERMQARTFSLGVRLLARRLSAMH